MHKLVILVHLSDAWQAREDDWPKFLHLVEALPGLRKEATCRVERFLFGGPAIGHVHELYFDSLADAERAMTSTLGQEAGRLLQKMSGGQMTLFFADHKEDDLDNIRKYRQTDEAQPQA